MTEGPRRAARPAAAVIAAVLAACGGSADRRADAPAPPAAGAAPQAAAPGGGAPDGAALYARTCQMCHQSTGLGLGGAYPPLAGSAIVAGEPELLIRIVLHGLQGPIVVAGKPYNNVMPPWKSQLSDAEIAAILTFERSHFGNAATPVSTAQVAAVRAATSSRSGPLTARDLEP